MPRRPYYNRTKVSEKNEIRIDIEPEELNDSNDENDVNDMNDEQNVDENDDVNEFIDIPEIKIKNCNSEK